MNVIVAQHINLLWPPAPDSEPYVLLLVRLQPTPPLPVYIYPVPIYCQKICSLRTYTCRIYLQRHTTWGKWWLCLNATWFALTQHGLVCQILKQLKSITLDCEKANVMNIHVSVVLHCVVIYINQVMCSWQESGNDRTFVLVGARKKIVQSVSRENSKTWH